MSSTQSRLHVLYRGLLNEFDEDEDEELDFGELDVKTYNLQSELNRLQPNRDPRLETDYLGISGDVELLFNCRISWMDRDADVEDYLDNVQESIENELDMIISEREYLGTINEGNSSNFYGNH